MCLDGRHVTSGHQPIGAAQLSIKIVDYVHPLYGMPSIIANLEVFFTREDGVHRFGFFGSRDHDNRNNGEAIQMKTLHLIVFSSHVDWMDFDAARFCFSAERVAFVRYFVTQYV